MRIRTDKQRSVLCVENRQVWNINGLGQGAGPAAVSWRNPSYDFRVAAGMGGMQTTLSATRRCCNLMAAITDEKTIAHWSK